MERAFTALQEFKTIITKSGCEKTIAVGTAGFRNAKNADEFILAIVQRDRDLVCTADRGLRRALKERGIPRIALRKRRRCRRNGKPTGRQRKAPTA